MTDSVWVYVSDFGTWKIPTDEPTFTTALWTKSGTLDRRATKRNKRAFETLREMEDRMRRIWLGEEQ